MQDVLGAASFALVFEQYPNVSSDGSNPGQGPYACKEMIEFAEISECHEQQRRQKCLRCTLQCDPLVLLRSECHRRETGGVEQE